MYSHSYNSLAIAVVTDNNKHCLNIFQPMLLSSYQLQLDISVFAQSSRNYEMYCVDKDYKCMKQDYYNMT